jgi:hypothetical protein
MSALSVYRTRILQYLFDTGSAIWSTDAIDEALRHALSQYNQLLPYTGNTVITLPGDGREIDLSSIANLRAVTDVYWPYDSTVEVWPPNRIRGYTVYFDDSNAILYLTAIDGDQPQTGDELRLWYAANHSIQDLDSASTTTLPDEHESLLCTGAAGQAAFMRTVDLIETSGADLYGTGLLGSWANKKLMEFNTQLALLARGQARGGVAYGEGWKLDKWDA